MVVYVRVSRDGYRENIRWVLDMIRWKGRDDMTFLVFRGETGLWEYMYSLGKRPHEMDFIIVDHNYQVGNMTLSGGSDVTLDLNGSGAYWHNYEEYDSVGIWDIIREEMGVG